MPTQLEQSVNLAWVLLCGFLVMFMQVGFAMVETGFTRSRNAANTMAMNLVIYPVGVLGFWLVGYGIMYGGMPEWPTLGGPVAGSHEAALRLLGRSYGLFGTAKFALVSVSQSPASLGMFLFAVVFMDTAATIPTGAMAERWKFTAFMIYGVFMSMLLYPVYGNWVWGGGWLASQGANAGLGHGVVDFAGSSVVHMTGGITALAGVRCSAPGSASTAPTAPSGPCSATTSPWRWSGPSSWRSGGSASTPGRPCRPPTPASPWWR